jgi:hypothetical protein
MATDAYNDAPTAEELKLLEEADRNPVVPPAEDDDSNPILPADVAAEAGLDPVTGKPVAPAPAPAPVAGEPGAEASPAPTGQTEDQKRAAFLEQHKDKSPEELAQLLYQQTQRAAQSGFAKRQTEQTLENIRTAATQLAERRERLKTARAAFDTKLAEDPDAATRDVNERLMTAEEREIADEELGLKRAEMFTVAATAIPEFEKQAPMISQFAGEMNYSPAELDKMTDPRDMVTLYLASVTGRLMKAGILNLRGEFLQMPTPVQETDPRLKTNTPPITTLSTAPARTTGGAQSVADQLAAYNAMTDQQMEEYDRANPGAIEKLLRAAG